MSMKLRRTCTQRILSLPAEAGTARAGTGIHCGLAMRSCLAQACCTARLAGAFIRPPFTAATGVVYIRGTDTSGPATIEASPAGMSPESAQCTAVLVSALVEDFTADAANNLQPVSAKALVASAYFLRDTIRQVTEGVSEPKPDPAPGADWRSRREIGCIPDGVIAAHWENGRATKCPALS